MGWMTRAGCVLLAVFLSVPGPAAAGDREETVRGASQVRSGQYTAATTTLRGVLEKDPGNREARLWLARALSFSANPK